MTPLRVVLAVAAGLTLATMPFLHYMALGGVEAHADHEPRYGGQLGMVGDHHIEVRRHAGVVEAFVSDARRRLVRPRAASAKFGDTQPTRLDWDRYRLIGPDVADTDRIEVIVILEDGTHLTLGFDFSKALQG